MKSDFRHWVFPFLVLLLCRSGVALAADAAATAGQMNRIFASGKVDGLAEIASPQVQKGLGEPAFSQVAAACRKRFGNFVEFRGTPRLAAEKDGISIFTQQAVYERAELLFTCCVDRQGKVVGFFFKPLSAAVPAAAPAAAHVAEETIVIGKEWPLGATLTLPAKAKGPFPLVVLVHGSGPLDRDETVGPNQPFREIAHGLARYGIASLRYDKRTFVHGEKMAKRTNLTVNDETVDDAVTAMAQIAADPRIDPNALFFLGHSLGGMMLPRIAARTALPTGFVFMAAPARPLAVLIREQMLYLHKAEDPRDPTAEAKAGAAAAALYNAAPASYRSDLEAYHQVDAARGIGKPLLFLQGGRDYQVTVEDFKLWQQAFPSGASAAFIFYDNLNHLMQPGAEPSRPAEYGKPVPCSAKVIEDIAGFILKHSGR
jgi:hypothetical protein